MAITDILLVLIIIFSVYNGWRRGFILGIAELFAWAGSLVLALFLYKYVAMGMESAISSPIWLLPISLLVTLLIVRAIMAYVSHRILIRISKESHLTSTNKILGIIPGLINGVIYAVLVTVLLLMVPITETISADVEKSRLAAKLAVGGEWLQSKIAPVFEEMLNGGGRTITEEPKAGESIKLPFKVDTKHVRQDLEVEMLDLINEERAKEGLKPLQPDPAVAVVARAHSVDMFARGYFSHITPEGNDPFYRLRKGGIRFLAAGENLALAPTLEIAHKGLMNSPGHKANILHKSFGRVGIGVIDGGMRGLMFTQNFRN